MTTKTVPLGPTLVLLVGPSCAGKSTYAKQFSPSEIVSSDALRQEFTGDFRRQDMNDLVQNEYDRRIKTRLEAGLRVVADATHIKDADRRRTARLAAETGARLVYLVFNRPLVSKLSQAGWREHIRVNGKPLVVAHDETFTANERKILAGDSLGATVIDTRKEVPEIVFPLSRDAGAFGVEQAPLMDIHSRGYAGILAVGDVHGNVNGLHKMIRYSRENRLFMLFLGDIVDYATETLEAADMVGNLIFRGEAVSILGNHEKKILKWIINERIRGIFANDDRCDAANLEREIALQSGITLTDHEVMDLIGPGYQGHLSEGNDVTVNQLKAMSREDRLKWETRFIGMCALMPHTIRMPRYFFTHGAALPSMLDTTEFRFCPDSTEESFAVFGQTTGKHINGFPERIYDWVDEIPPRQTVVVGHDCRQSFPLIHAGKEGGRAIFLDTGSSKPDRLDGACLSGMVLEIDNRKKIGFVLDNERFVSENDL